MSSRPFLRDLRSFLSLSEDAIRATAELANGPDGFLGDRQSRELAERSGITADTALAVLRVADYLYLRAANLRMGPAEAVAQIAAVASSMDEPVILAEVHRDAIAAVLSFKSDYERTVAGRNATATGPHFTDVKGSWAVKLAELSNGETIRLPVLSLTITWHDGTGTYHEAFLQMSGRDWEKFNSQMKSVTDGRDAIEEILGL